MGFQVKYLDESGEKIDKMIGLKNVRLSTLKLKDKNGTVIELLKFKSHPSNKSWSDLHTAQA